MLGMTVFLMDKNDKNGIVEAYFSAADAMLSLGETPAIASDRKVIPFYQETSTGRLQVAGEGADGRLEVGTSKVCIVETVNLIRSTRTGIETSSPLIERELAGPFTVRQGSVASKSTVVYWEDLEKHQWMLDVLADLEAYASENSLAETAEALVAARRELILLSARAR